MSTFASGSELGNKNWINKSFYCSFTYFSLWKVRRDFYNPVRVNCWTNHSVKTPIFIYRVIIPNARKRPVSEGWFILVCYYLNWQTGKLFCTGMRQFFSYVREQYKLQIFKTTLRKQTSFFSGVTKSQQRRTKTSTTPLWKPEKLKKGHAVKK